MTLQLDWSPEVVNRLIEEARQNGLSLDDYLLQTVLQKETSSVPTFSNEAAKHQARNEAGQSIRELRKGNILGPDLTIRDLVEEGRLRRLEVMDWRKDIEAEVTFLPTHASGRQGPAFSGYRPQFFYDGHDWDAIQTYPDVEQVNPGDTVRVHFTFLSPELHTGKVVPGKRFLLREGQRVVGYGQVTCILRLEEFIDVR